MTGVKADGNQWRWKWGGTVEHDNYEYRIYGEKHSPHKLQSKPTPKPKETSAADIPPVQKPSPGPPPANCPQDQIHPEEKRECYSANIKKTYHTHVRAQFPRDSGLRIMDLACSNGPPPPHRLEIYVHQTASNGEVYGGTCSG